MQKDISTPEFASTGANLQVLQPDSAPLLKSALTAVAAAALTACGGGEGEGSGSSPVPGSDPSTASYTVPTPASDAHAARFLLQASFSASQAEIDSVRSLGYSAWIQDQWAKPVGTTGWDWLNAQGYGDATNPANYYDNSYPGDYMIWSQLITAGDPMRKRAALALSELFVVSLSSLDLSWRSHAIAQYWDILVTHAFGNFRDLLEAITLNPAMGYYLNTKGNLKENVSTGRQPDENYAREVMQLFTVGLYLLNPDGTQKLDAGGKPQETYTAADVSNLARVFTGYDVDNTQTTYTPIAQTGGGTRNIPSTHYVKLPMRLTASNHSNLEVNFLDVNIPQNTSASDAMRLALNGLFEHPNTAPFVCKQLIQRLVTSNPSPAYVGRVAAVFANNGSGVRGSMKHVFAAILLDQEARSDSALTAPEFGKLSEPILRLVQWARTFSVTSTAGTWKIGDLSSAGSALGQSPLRSPSVFNFFRPGYVPPSTVSLPYAGLSAGKVAPEFQIVNETSVGGYMNYMMATYADEINLVLNPAALVEKLNVRLARGQLSNATITMIVNALLIVNVTANSSATLKRNRVCAAVLMVMATPEYLVQK
jgi:uncharacterized protein (DUF1800 family)